MKTCRICREKFEPSRPMQPTCQRYSCQVAYAERAAVKSAEKRKADIRSAERSAFKKRKEAIKTRTDWAKEAQAAANAYVRKRDEGLPCISCGRYHQGQNHAGHYLSRGAHPELALECRNIHLQCAPCNTHLSGNQINYRKGLIVRYGQEIVDWLEGHHQPKKYTIEQLKIIAREYKIATRLIKEKGNERNLASGRWLRIEV